MRLRRRLASEKRGAGESAILGPGDDLPPKIRAIASWNFPPLNGRMRMEPQRRHLTNQRTDAVAMSVLDPFEVYEIEVWPLPQFHHVGKRKTPKEYPDAEQHLNALENLVHKEAIEASMFKAVLNEKDPPAPTLTVTKPPSLRFRIVSDDVYSISSHPDFRIARRALIISRLAQVISERKVQGGLRRVLTVQAKRLNWLAEQRYHELGGAASVEKENGDDDSGGED